jgi:hypothetical protein
LGGDFAVLVVDETDIRLFPSLRSGWALKGEEAKTPISGYNEKRVLFGAINIATGHRVWLVRKHQKQKDFQIYLDVINYHYRNYKVVLLLDEDSSHTAYRSQSLARKHNFQLLWLPKRSPHLNPMDHLWRHGKNNISSNVQYETIDEHVFRFIHYLDGLSNQQALDKSGLLSKTFWLYKSTGH